MKEIFPWMSPVAPSIVASVAGRSSTDFFEIDKNEIIARSKFLLLGLRSEFPSLRAQVQAGEYKKLTMYHRIGASNGCPHRPRRAAWDELLEKKGEGYKLRMPCQTLTGP